MQILCVAVLSVCVLLLQSAYVAAGVSSATHTTLSSRCEQYKAPLLLQRDMSEEFSMLMTRFDSWFHTLQARRSGSAVHIAKRT